MLDTEQDRDLDSALDTERDRDLDSAMKQDPSQLVRYTGLVNRGVLHYRRKAWAEAVRDLRDATKLRPEAPPAYINLSMALEKQGKLEEAKLELDEAIRRAPSTPSLYASRASLHVLRKDRDAAVLK